jgi:hypothetical protein
VQWNGYEPGFVGAVKVVVPSEAESSKELPSSEVTVCSVPSLLSTVIVAPGLTESGVENWKPEIVIVAAALPASEEDALADDELDDDSAVELDDDEPDGPQATRATAHRPTRTERVRTSVRDMTVPSMGGGCAGGRGRLRRIGTATLRS